MNRLIQAAVITVLYFGSSINAFASMSYECWSYKGGDLGKMVKVTADDRNQAEQLAAKKFDNLSVRYDTIKCK